MFIKVDVISVAIYLREKVCEHKSIYNVMNQHPKMCIKCQILTYCADGWPSNKKEKNRSVYKTIKMAPEKHRNVSPVNLSKVFCCVCSYITGAICVCAY